MNGLDVLWLVYELLPVAIFADLLVFTFTLVWVRRWRRLRGRGHE